MREMLRSARNAGHFAGRVVCRRLPVLASRRPLVSGLPAGGEGCNGTQRACSRFRLDTSVPRVKERRKRGRGTCNMPARCRKAASLWCPLCGPRSAKQRTSGPHDAATLFILEIFGNGRAKGSRAATAASRQVAPQGVHSALAALAHASRQVLRRSARRTRRGDDGS